MTPLNQQASRRLSRHSRLALTTVAFALVAAVAPATAATFQYRHLVMGLASSPTAQVKQAAVEIVVALTGGPALPEGEVNWPYNYDLKQLLTVNGDTSYSSTNVSWELHSGSLPAGLSLGSDGVVSGIPTTKNLVGDSFQVKASYKGKTGQQPYTIVVNGATLHVTQLVSGASHVCALTTSGGVKCWGDDTYGQLGNNSTLASSSIPVPVSGLTSGVVSITAGEYHTCAVTAGGGAKCWGWDAYGQLGDSTAFADKPTPVDVAGLASGVARLESGRWHTCAVMESGGVRCWGSDTYGQLGNDAALANKGTPADVFGLGAGVASVSAGGMHTCAVTLTGGVKCWGNDSYGQLGNDVALADKATPVDVFELSSGVSSVAAGGAHSCAVTATHGVKCWGYDFDGQLGNDLAIADKPIPVDVYGLSSGVLRIDAGRWHSCAVMSDGRLACWGRNLNAELGIGSAGGLRAVPVIATVLGSGVREVAVGYYHTCVTSTAGSAYCWGLNTSGQLGNGSTTQSLIPVAVSP